MEPTDYALARIVPLPYAYAMAKRQKGKTIVRLNVERILATTAGGGPHIPADLARAMHTSQQNLNGMLSRAGTNMATTLERIAQGLTVVKKHDVVIADLVENPEIRDDSLDSKQTTTVRGKPSHQTAGSREVGHVGNVGQSPADSSEVGSLQWLHSEAMRHLNAITAKASHEIAAALDSADKIFTGLLGVSPDGLELIDPPPQPPKSNKRGGNHDQRVAHEKRRHPRNRAS